MTYLPPPVTGGGPVPPPKKEQKQKQKVITLNGAVGYGETPVELPSIVVRQVVNVCLVGDEKEKGKGKAATRIGGLCKAHCSSY
jgi:hypothetical protein